MPKLLTRLVAFVLAGCLTADPALASAVQLLPSLPSAVQSINPNQFLFNQDALSVRAPSYMREAYSPMLFTRLVRRPLRSYSRWIMRSGPTLLRWAAAPAMLGAALYHTAATATAAGATAAIQTVDALTTLPLEIIIKRGDTLSGLAKTYGLENWKVLQNFNHLANPNLIIAGKKILIPGQASAIHSIAPQVMPSGPPALPAFHFAPGAIPTPPDVSLWPQILMLAGEAALVGIALYGAYALIKRLPVKKRVQAFTDKLLIRAYVLFHEKKMRHQAQALVDKVLIRIYALYERIVPIDKPTPEPVRPATPAAQPVTTLRLHLADGDASDIPPARFSPGSHEPLPLGELRLKLAPETPFLPETVKRKIAAAAFTAQIQIVPVANPVSITPVIDHTLTLKKAPVQPRIMPLPKIQLKTLRKKWNEIRFAIYADQGAAEKAYSDFASSLNAIPKNVAAKKPWKEFIRQVQAEHRAVEVAVGPGYTLVAASRIRPAPVRRAPPKVARVGSRMTLGEDDPNAPVVRYTLRDPLASAPLRLTLDIPKEPEPSRLRYAEAGAPVGRLPAAAYESQVAAPKPVKQPQPQAGAPKSGFFAMAEALQKALQPAEPKAEPIIIQAAAPQSEPNFLTAPPAVLPTAKPEAFNLISVVAAELEQQLPLDLETIALAPISHAESLMIPFNTPETDVQPLVETPAPAAETPAAPAAAAATVPSMGEKSDNTVTEFNAKVNALGKLINASEKPTDELIQQARALSEELAHLTQAAGDQANRYAMAGARLNKFLKQLGVTPVTVAAAPAAPVAPAAEPVKAQVPAMAPAVQDAPVPAQAAVPDQPEYGFSAGENHHVSLEKAKQLRRQYRETQKSRAVAFLSLTGVLGITAAAIYLFGNRAASLSVSQMQNIPGTWMIAVSAAVVVLAALSVIGVRWMKKPKLDKTDALIQVAAKEIDKPGFKITADVERNSDGRAKEAPRPTAIAAKEPEAPRVAAAPTQKASVEESPAGPSLKPKEEFNRRLDSQIARLEKTPLKAYEYPVAVKKFRELVSGYLIGRPGVEQSDIDATQQKIDQALSDFKARLPGKERDAVDKDTSIRAPIPQSTRILPSNGTVKQVKSNINVDADGNEIDEAPDGRIRAHANESLKLELQALSAAILQDNDPTPEKRIAYKAEVDRIDVIIKERTGKGLRSEGNGLQKEWSLITGERLLTYDEQIKRTADQVAKGDVLLKKPIQAYNMSLYTGQVLEWDTLNRKLGVYDYSAIRKLRGKLQARMMPPSAGGNIDSVGHSVPGAVGVMLRQMFRQTNEVFASLFVAVGILSQGPSITFLAAAVVGVLVFLGWQRNRTPPVDSPRPLILHDLATAA